MVGFATDDETQPLTGGGDSSNNNGATTNNDIENLSSNLNSTMSDSTASKVTTGLLVVFGILILIASFQFSFVVKPGQIGIVVTLGHVSSYDPGFHFRPPFISTVVFLSSQTQLLTEKNVVPTKEGLSVSLDTAILFRLDPKEAATVYASIGPQYASVLIRPEAAAATRGLTSESEAKVLYTNGRNALQQSLHEELRDKLGPRGIVIEDVLLKDIQLPTQLSQAIEAKVQAEQDAERMEFVLQKEEQEAQRKAIEAKGIADFQRIVSEGISEELLKWKGIEATERLSDSTNSKIVVIGNTGDGLPVLLSADDKK